MTVVVRDRKHNSLSDSTEVSGKECVWLLQSSAKLTEVLLLLIPLLDKNTVLHFVLSVQTCSFQ